MAGELAAFLAQNSRREKVRVAVSERFVDEQGRPLLWELEPLTAVDMQELLLEGARGADEQGRQVRCEDIMLRLLARSVSFPDLNDAGLQDSYGVMGAERLLLQMLSPGEYRVLQGAFEKLNLCGDLSEQVAQAKN